MVAVVKRTISILVVAVGLMLPAAASADAPPGATALCNDGTYSYSTTRSGTCSHHGGVAVWLTGTPSPPPAPVPPPAPSPTPPPAPPAPPTAPVFLVSSTSLAVRTRTIGCRRGVLPDRRCSPGAYDPAVTQANIQSTICVSGYTATVRDVPTSEKNAVYKEYGITRHASYSYEVDHIVSLELGGSNNIANLYPEAYANPNGARVKDRLENAMHAAVCGGTLALKTAQAEIASNWLATYQHFGFR
jgi:hypothetical protein